MSLVLYNTRTRRKEVFEPLNPGKVGLYVCGVTVYDHPHIGHARCYVAFDAMVRHFQARGYEVTYVRNFTDIDDKIINRAHETGQDPAALSSTYIDSFSQDMAALGCLTPQVEPRATGHIPDIIQAVQTLVEKGHAYPVEGGDVFFRVSSFAPYGGLSGRDPDQLRAGARIEVDQRKENPMDFALWKGSKPGEPQWDSPWGPGRPGWHIECSVMSARYLGPTFDIHGGGEDLVFPHHENEVAQSEALTGQPFARYWLHNGFVRVDQEKMSKSLGNFFTIKDVLAKVRPETLRLFLLGKHYRAPLDFSDQALEEAHQALERLYIALRAADQDPGPAGQTPAEVEQAAVEFDQAMDDDFNTPRALSQLFVLARLANREPAARTACAAQLRALGARLGLLGEDPEQFLQGAAPQAQAEIDPDQVQALVDRRTAARQAKDFAQADKLRDQLAGMGVILEDSPQGTTWRMG